MQTPSPTTTVPPTATTSSFICANSTTQSQHLSIASSPPITIAFNLHPSVDLYQPPSHDFSCANSIDHAVLFAILCTLHGFALRQRLSSTSASHHIHLLLVACSHPPPLQMQSANCPDLACFSTAIPPVVLPRSPSPLF